MRLLRKGVDDALGLVDLGLALGDVLTESLTSGSHLRARDADGLGNLVTSEPLALVTVEEALNGLDTSANLALLLGIGGLPLGITGIKPRDVLGGQSVHLIGDVSVKHGLEVLTSGDVGVSHDVFLSRVMRVTALVATLIYLVEISLSLSVFIIPQDF